MKKLIFTLASIASIGAFAQAPLQTPQTFKVTGDVSAPMKSTQLGKASVSNWYEPFVWVGAVDAEGNSVFNRFVSFVFPDSLVRQVDETSVTTYGPNATNFGMVVDPKDENLNLVNQFDLVMSKYTSYTLDSIYFRYLYVRNVDSIPDGVGGKKAVVDTLFVDYFSGNGLSNGSLTGTPAEKFAVPNFDMANRKPTGGMVTTQTILLTRDDSTSAVADASGNPESSWTTNIYRLNVPAGVSINPSRNNVKNQVAFNVRFKPGHDYYKGASLADSSSIIVYQKASSTLPANAKRANYFGYFAYSNGTAAPYPTQIPQTTYLTNAFFATKAASYPNSSSGAWQGYIPGNAYFAHQYLQAGVLLTSSNVGIKEIKNDLFAVSNVYPNPARVNETGAIAFNLKSSAKVNVDIFNIAGQQVKSVISGNFAAGEHAQEFSLSGLKAGIYLVNMTVNGVSQTKKLTITE